VSRPAEKLVTRREIVANLAAPPDAADDPGQLHRLLAIEQLAIAVYGLARRSRHLTPRAISLMAALELHERAHASALTRLPGGVTPVPQLQGTEEIQTALGAIGIHFPLASLRDQRLWFWLVEMLEHRLEGAYFKALLILQAKPAVGLASRIFASEAQHAAVLYLRRDPADLGNALPGGLVHGSGLPGRRK
jgi:hypothetical protein